MRPGTWAASPYAEDNRVGIKAFTTPWLTFALLGGLVAVFVLEQKYAIGPLGPGLRPSLATLQALGALSGEAVLTHGEWYRLFTAPLLHANVWHLIGNGTALFMAGYVLENLAGRAWLAALFVVGGLGGAVDVDRGQSRRRCPASAHRAPSWPCSRQA